MKLVLTHRSYDCFIRNGKHGNSSAFEHTWKAWWQHPEQTYPEGFRGRQFISGRYKEKPLRIYLAGHGIDDQIRSLRRG